MPFDDGIRTVSGSIAHTDDAAAKVPFVSLKCGIAPTLTGKSAIDVVQTGKNLVNIPDSAEITRNQLNSNIVPLLNDFLNGKKGNFTISAKTAETVENSNFITIRINYTDGSSSSNIYIYRGSTHGSGGITGAFSISSDPTKIIDSIYFGGNTGTAKCAISEWQIEANSQATTYELYTAPTTHAVQLGRTIYGGKPDIVNGVGSETWEKKVYTGADNEYWVLSKSGDIYRYYVINDNVKQPTGRGVAYSSIGQYSASGNDVGTCFTYYSSGINRVLIYYIPPQTIQTVEDFKTWLSSNNFDIVYELATPTDFTFTPITPTPETVGKVNNVYCNTGDTELTYHDNAHGFASVTVTKQAPDQADEVKTAYLHKVIFGGLVDVIQGKAEPKNLGELSAETYNQSQKCTWEYITGGAVVTATGTYARVGFVIPVETGKTYTVSYRGFSDGEYRRVYFNSTPAWSGQFYNNVLSDTDTLYTRTFTASTDVLFVGLYVTAGTTTGTLTFSDFMLVEGDQAEDFAPYFDPFSFPPISISTDEGENTLFANEGDSAITYRRAVD